MGCNSGFKGLISVVFFLSLPTVTLLHIEHPKVSQPSVYLSVTLPSKQTLITNQRRVMIRGAPQPATHIPSYTPVIYCKRKQIQIVKGNLKQRK